MPAPSKIFVGYRALGFVSNHIPLAVRFHRKHKENYVVTCVGKCFHTYACSGLGIVSVSDSHPGDISCLAVDAVHVFTACGNVIRAFDKGRKVIHTYEGHKKDVHLLLPFGKHLISVDTSSTVKVWDIASEELYLEMSFLPKSFEVTTMMHPSTYLNKILFGSKQGSAQLWNIRSDSMVYTFKGWDSPITVLEQAPAVDVAALGLADGRIILHNLKFDESLMTFKQDWGPVTTVSFRTDGHPVMVSGSAAGHIALWDLEKRKLQSQMRDAHLTSVTGMNCLPSEPLMVTSAADNTLKVWIFDLPDGGGRLLRQREGHSAPPNRVRYYGNNGQNILSAGQDSTLRCFSTVHDKHNKSLGRASHNKTKSKRQGLKQDHLMMPPITDFVAEPCRQSDWDNIIACHRSICTVTTWSFQRSTMGKYKFDHDRFRSPEFVNAVAQAVDISACGNFVLVGYSTGHVDMYNLQSGIFRGSYGDPAAHSCPVQGLAIDGLNQVVITAGRDDIIKFWKFKQKDFLGTLKLDVNIMQILLHRESAMLAVVLDDFRIAVVDIDTRRVVRRFLGHQNRINDMAFSPDARWLISSGMDCTIRTWDLPTGKMIDCFLLDEAVTSLSMSPTGDFLVTTHVDDVGVYLWSNLTLYTYVSLNPLPSDYEPQLIDLPSTSDRPSEPQKEEEKIEKEELEEYDFKSPAQISDELVTLSLLPHSRWQNLLTLDVIKERNKPKQPPKVPKAAPFFLPTIAGLQPKFAQVDDGSAKDENKSHFLSAKLQPLSVLGKLLQDSMRTQSFDAVLSQIKEMGPSKIDLEIRCLCPEWGGSIDLLVQFMKFIDSVLATNTNFEIAQAYLGLFLKTHGELIAKEPRLTVEAQRLLCSQSESWKKLEDLFTQSLCLVSYLRTATL